MFSFELRNVFKVLFHPCFMLNKRDALRVILGLAGVFAVLPFASAYTYDIVTVVRSTIDSIIAYTAPVFEALLGEYQSSEFFFVKCMLLILLFVMITGATKVIPTLGKNKGVSMVISIIVSIIAVRYISETQMIKGILLPYGALGIALVTILPFLIFFYFIHSTGMAGMGRRLCWIFFGIVFIALFISRYDQLPTLGRQIYIASIILIAAVFMFDKAIHRYFFLHELSIFYRKAANKSVAALQAEYLNIINVDSPEAAKRRKDIEADLSRLGGNIP